MEAIIPGGWSTVNKLGGSNPDLYKAIQEAPAGNRAMEFLEIANSMKVPTGLHIHDCQKHMGIAEKTKDENKSNIRRFSEDFLFLLDIKLRAVTVWIEERLDAGKSGKIVGRYLSALNIYWKYLDNVELVDAEVRNPFARHRLPVKSTRVRVLPWKDEEIIQLFHAAVDRRAYPQLPLLILIAAYSGMREEEICQLKIGTDVDRKKLILQVGKTEAARRLVPVHQELKNLIDHLCSTSKDGWLISSLKSGNKYGKQSHNIAQRFGDLKTDLGFPKREENFHSFRHSCSTKLREANLEDYWIQQIIGHKTGRLSGVPDSTVTDQYTFSPQNFESKNYDTKKAHIDKVRYDGVLDVSSPYLKSIIGN